RGNNAPTASQWEDAANACIQNFCNTDTVDVSEGGRSTYWAQAPGQGETSGVVTATIDPVLGRICRNENYEPALVLPIRKCKDNGFWEPASAIANPCVIKHCGASTIGGNTNGYANWLQGNAGQTSTASSCENDYIP